MAVDTPAQAVSWLKAHELMIIVFLVLVTGVWGFNKWINSSAQNASNKAAIAAQALEVDRTQDTKNALQSAQTVAEYQAMVDTLSKQNASLAASVASRQVILTQQQTTDKVLPLPALISRWETLAGVTGITVTSSGAQVPIDAAVKTVTTLEEVPVLTQDLTDTRTLYQNEAKELLFADQSILSLQTEVSGLNKTVADDDKSCKAEISSVKASDRKSKRNWFAGGVVVGIVAAIKIALL